MGPLSTHLASRPARGQLGMQASSVSLPQLGWPTDLARVPSDQLIRSGELHVGLRDFDDDVIIADRYTRLELDVNFEIWAVLTDKCFSS